MYIYITYVYIYLFFIHPLRQISDDDVVSMKHGQAYVTLHFELCLTASVTDLLSRRLKPRNDFYLPLKWGCFFIPRAKHW